MRWFRWWWYSRDNYDGDITGGCDHDEEDDDCDDDNDEGDDDDDSDVVNGCDDDDDNDDAYLFQQFLYKLIFKRQIALLLRRDIKHIR